MKKGKKTLWIGCLCAVLCIGAALFLLREKKDPTLAEMTRWEGPSSCAVGDLNYYLPEGCSQEQVEILELKDREMLKYLEAKKGIYPYTEVFREGENVIGGINSYYLPESFTPAQFDWIEDLGLWETLGHYGESGSEYVWSVEFFTDLPGDPPDKVQSRHYFFLSEDMSMVYDLWFDMLSVDSEIYRQILDSCRVGGGRHWEVATPQNTADPETFPVNADLATLSPDSGEWALEQCRSVLEQIQSRSRALRCERHSTQDDGVIEYWLHEEDWMTIQTHSDDSVIGFLYKDGTHYDNGGMMGDKIGMRDENGDLLWKQGEQRETFHIPWLSRYQWKEEAVVFLGTKQTEEEIHIHLCVKEPFPGFEWGNAQYAVTMVFDREYSFLRAELSVNEGHSSQSEFTETETVVSLDSETVRSQMDEKCRNLLT